MISVIDWLPARMPLSVDTSKITASVGTCSLIWRSSTVALVSSMRWLRSGPAWAPSKARFSMATPSIFAKLDLPEPKKPEIHTAVPSWGLRQRLHVGLKHGGLLLLDRRGDDVVAELLPHTRRVGVIDLDDLLDAVVDVVREEGRDGASAQGHSTIHGR
jgi:hypothetical protein